MGSSGARVAGRWESAAWVTPTPDTFSDTGTGVVESAAIMLGTDVLPEDYAEVKVEIRFTHITTVGVESHAWCRLRGQQFAEKPTSGAHTTDLFTMLRSVGTTSWDRIVLVDLPVLQASGATYGDRFVVYVLGKGFDSSTEFTVSNIKVRLRYRR